MIEAYEQGKAPPFEAYALGLQHKHVPEIMKYAGLTRRPLFVPGVGNFRQGMLVQLPLHLDALPGQPKAADLHHALQQHYGAHASGFVSVHPATDNGKLDDKVLHAAAEKAGVFSTPTLKLNGKDLPLQQLSQQYLTDQVKAATK